MAGCGPGPAPGRVTVRQQPWTQSRPDGVQLITAHFDIRTTIRDTLLRDALPGFMETAFAEYTRLMPPEAEEAAPLPVYLFETREEWAAFTRHFVPQQAYTYLHIHAGGYTDHRTGASITFDIGRDHTLSLLAHEGFHQYVARYRTLPLPAWLNEGLACQFEAFTLDGDHPTFTPQRNLLRTGALRAALLQPPGLAALPELLSMHAGQAVRQTGVSAPTYYAQLWSTVLYLRDRSCPYASGFRRLLADAGTPRLTEAIRQFRAASPEHARLNDAEAAFRCYITSDLGEFATRYRAFAEQLVH